MQYSREMLRTLSGSNTKHSLLQWVDAVIRDISKKVLRTATASKVTSYEYMFHKELLSISSGDYDGTGYRTKYFRDYYLQFFRNADAGVYVLDMICAGLRKSFPDCNITYSWISQSNRYFPPGKSATVRDKYNVFLRSDEIANLPLSRLGDPFLDVVRHKDNLDDHVLPGCSRIMITVNWS